MAGDDTVRMPIDAVRRHAGSIDTIADAVEQGADAANHVHLGADAYGQLCQFIPSLLEPVSDAAVSALRDTVTALRDTADKLRAAAATSESTDVRTSATVTATQRTVNLPL